MSRFNVRHVKFSPEEMAYDAPSDVSDPKRFPVLARGRREWEQFLSVKRGYVRLDADLREFYQDEQEVNDLLRRLMEMSKKTSAKNRKKSA